MPRSARLKVVGTVVAAIATLVASTSCSSDSATGSDVGAGDPIVIGMMAPEASQVVSQPQRQETAKAAIEAINASGGINGHDVQLNFCDTRHDPNAELSCMRTFIKDKVSAVVGPAIIADQSGRPYEVAAQAGMPIIGGAGLTPAEMDAETSFPIGSGIPGLAYGAADALINAGAKKISLMGTNEPGSIYILGLSEQALKGAGVTPTTWVKADPQADPTFAASAALAMANGVDGIVLSSSQLLMPKEVTALRQAGYKGLISSLSAIFAEKTREALGDQANGILVSGLLAFQSDTANPEVARYLAEMQKYAPSTDTNENSMVTWAAIQLFATVMKSADGYNSEDVLSAFNNVSSPVEIGVIGPFQVKGAKEYLPDFSRIFNPTVSNGKIVDGELVSDGQGFVNPFEPINAAGN